MANHQNTEPSGSSHTEPSDSSFTERSGTASGSSHTEPSDSPSGTSNYYKPGNNPSSTPEGFPPGTPTAFVVVGVTAAQPDVVALRAATFAARFDAELVCASVDARSYAIEEGLDGSLRTMPFDPDATEPGNAEFDPALRARLARLLDGQGVVWSTRTVVGDPARALGNLAEELDAAMIVVGSREPGVRSSLHEFFAGSVAAHLAHVQHRPVVVVPLAPVPPGSSLPWGA